VIPVIHVHSQSDKATIGYVTFMWESMRALANHPESLRLSLHCIGPTATERLKELPGNVKSYYVPNAEVDKGMSGSTAHGACIEHALQMTDDGDIHLLVDADTVVLAKGWDDYVRLSVIDRKVGMIGTAVEDIGGFTSGGGTVQMAKNKPTVAWCALSPLHQWRMLKARPAKESSIPIKTEEQAKIYGLPVGYEVLRDVAWQIPEYLYYNGISYEAWKQLKPTKDATVLKGLSDYHEEYHVLGNVPFVVHQRGSMRHAYRGDRISQNFYAAVDAYLAKEKGNNTRWLWQPSTDNEAALQSMQSMKEQHANRIRELESKAGVIPGWPSAPPPPPAPPHGVQSSTTVAPQPGPTVPGWLKATLDGRGVFGRYTQPVPQSVEVVFTPDMAGKHLRLEGTVANVVIVLPGTEAQHWMTVRNLTAGPAKLTIPNGRVSLDVPVGACWQVLVDVDGPVHVT
jgi:hypothetical protein